ncbi:MAG: sugar transferase [Gemmatimonadales bacterium]|nr:MAG: sugar transferase [Gemmatimonadales bacterium]
MRRTADSAKRTFAGHGPRQTPGSTYSSAGLVLPTPRQQTLVLRPDSLPATPRSELTDVPRWHAVARRGINVVVSLLLILLTAPLMLGIAVAVKLTSRGPVLYRQKRVGLDRRRDEPGAPPHPRRQRDLGGRIFEILKFRTMTHRPESEDSQVWAEADDPRVTKVGRILRRYRLDEIPQLFNVLNGDMNLVGPRPEQPEIFRRLRTEIDGYQYRQRVLPGITGLAQVNLHYDQCLEDVRRKVCLDLMYVEKESPLEDLRIMARTVPVVLFGQGSQ